MPTHPLTTPAEWQFQPGMVGPAVLPYVGGALWLSSAAVLLVWVAAILHDAVVWGFSPLPVLSALLLSLAWLGFASHVWWRWRLPQDTLTLEWTGLPSTDAPVNRRDEALSPVGFRVQQWQLAVQPRIILNLQQWQLLRIKARGADLPWRKVPVVWVWFDTRSGPSAHKLRTLLQLPLSMIEADAQSLPMQVKVRA